MTKTILITGATDGIGLALARKFNELDARLVLLGRRSLGSLAADPLFNGENYCQVDLGQAWSMAALAAFLTDNEIPSIDLVIHNAGLGYVGPLASLELARLEQILQVNVGTPLALTHALVQKWLKPRARLVFISSVVASWPAPHYAVYAASKAALDSFVRNLQIEWRDRPLQLILLHPGATRTGMHAKSGLDKSSINWERWPTAAAVAQQIIDRIDQAPKQAALGAVNGLIYRAGNWLQPAVDRFRDRVRHRRQRGRSCLITGAAQGIGQALAHRYAAAGYEIIAVDIDAVRLDALTEAIKTAGGCCRPVVADLERMAGWQALLAATASGPALGVVIHNAGINAFGRFAEMGWREQERVLTLNLLAPLWLTTAMIQQGSVDKTTGLVFLASLSHYLGYPGAAVYAASKDGVTSLARSLRAAGWRSLVVFPGPTRTEHARRYSPDNSREEGRMAPEAVAAAIFAAERRGRRRLVPGWRNKGLALLGWLAPGFMALAMRRALYEKIDV